MRGAAFQQKSFSVSAATMSTRQSHLDAECQRVGHTEPDAHGWCYRCGKPVTEPDEPPSAAAESA